MKRAHLYLSGIFLGIFGVLFPLPSLRSEAYREKDAPRYTVIELRAPEGGKAVRGNALNNLGQVVGLWFTVEHGEWFSHGFLWANVQMQDLEMFDAKAINDHGQIVGDSQHLTRSGVKQAALLWEKGRIRMVDTFSDSRIDFAFAINEKGQVLGWSEREKANTTTFLWQRGHARDINTAPTEPMFPPGVSSWYEHQSPYRLNNRGQIAGTLRFESASRPPTLPEHVFDHACIWQNGHLQDLGALPDYPQSQAEAINNRSEVVGATFAARSGAYSLGSIGHAFLWSHGQMQDLGTLPGDQISDARCINDHGQPVGYSASAGESHGAGRQHAVLWRNGRAFDLNGTLPVNSGFVLTDAVGINLRGQILCHGKSIGSLDSNDMHTFLLSPR